ncbi:hypothetical protein BDZ45DRAFT_750106 [Acephala macrosclerotiorum]|nr:hypothetical protein BDZ45DRAFT_750106 [Acephala macrosclerotiorum]
MEKITSGVTRRVEAVREAFSSKEAFIKAIKTQESATGRFEHRNHWKNEDLDTRKGMGTDFKSTVPMRGSSLAWAMLSSINSVKGKISALVVNQPDIACYARTRNTLVWSQALALPIGNTGCAALSIFATAAVKNAWSIALWNRWDLCDEILTRS